MSKPFISARIPEDLLEQLESHTTATHESKTEVLIKALKEYLNPASPSSVGDLSLERRVRHFESWISERLGSLENKVSDLEELKSFLPTATLKSCETKPSSMTFQKRHPIPPENQHTWAETAENSNSLVPCQ